MLVETVHNTCLSVPPCIEPSEHNPQGTTLMYLDYSAAALPGIGLSDPGEVLLRELGKSHVGVHLHGEQIVKPVHFGRNLD